MLSLISIADVAPNIRDQSRTGALPTCGGEAVPRDRALSVAVACPQPSTAAVHFGSGTTEAGQADFTWQQRTNKKFTHMTRIAMADGALGPHPARDPV